jgi:hypothetical protein
MPQLQLVEEKEPDVFQDVQLIDANEVIIAQNKKARPLTATIVITVLSLSLWAVLIYAIVQLIRWAIS